MITRVIGIDMSHMILVDCWSLASWQHVMSRGVVAELVERGYHVREIGSSVPGRVKSMTYKIDTWLFLAWRSVLVGCG